LRCSGGQPCERCLRRRIAHLCNYSTTCSELAAPPVGTPIDSAYSDIVNQERAIHARNYDMDLSCAHLREFNRKLYDCQLVLVFDEIVLRKRPMRGFQPPPPGIGFNINLLDGHSGHRMLLRARNSLLIHFS
jgi:hypothetical protein